MIKQIAVSLVAVIAITSTAFAYTSLDKTASPVAVIIQGHGNPGDTASSVSNPDVSVRVLDNSKVVRTNNRYGTVMTIDPRAEYRKSNRSR